MTDLLDSPTDVLSADAPFHGLVGQPLRRKEDPKLLTGEGKYTDDLVVPGALWMSVVRSPYAHATIKSIDVTQALAMPGVVAVYTGEDLRAEWGALPCAWPVTADMKNPEHLSLAVGKVAYVGDGVAAVIATSRAAAEDAMAGVVVEIGRAHV